MSEKDIIDKSLNQPVTISYLINDFKKLGVKSGMSLIVHSSLSSLGWVCGGPVSVILALEHLLTQEGTLIMPTHSSDYSDPQNWINPAVPESWWEIIKDQMPAFDEALTPTRGMGTISETFRKQEGVVRSYHPLTSFAVWGKDKEFFIKDTQLDYSMNEKSPLGKLYDKNGSILLLGVGYDKNTSLHLAEYKANYKGKRTAKEGFPIIKNGIKQWVEVDDIELSSDDFEQIGIDFEKEFSINESYIGKAKSKLINQKELVDYAVKWMGENRNI